LHCTDNSKQTIETTLKHKNKQTGPMHRSHALGKKNSQKPQIKPKPSTEVLLDDLD